MASRPHFAAFICIICPLFSAAQKDVPETRDKFDNVALAALIVGVVACVGVVFLSVIALCLIAHYRKIRRQQKVLSEIGLAEKSALPFHVDAKEAIVQFDQPTLSRQGKACVGVGTLRQVALSLLQDLLLNLYNVSVKRSTHEQQRPGAPGAALARKDPEPNMTVTSAGADEVQIQLKNGLVKIFPQDRAKVDTFMTLGQAIMTATSVRQLLDSALRTMRVCQGVVREWGVATEDYVGVVPIEGQGHVRMQMEDEVNCLQLVWDAHKLTPDLLTAVCQVCQALRDERRQPTQEEYLAVQLAYHLMAKGHQIPNPKVRPLGAAGFRQLAQTHIALTDSGYGHLLGTWRRSDWLQGVSVHVQHIGSLEDDHDLAPSLFDLGKVRLHVGDSAPTTFFVARASGKGSHQSVTSKDWEGELFRLVQLTSNTVSASFYQGAAACHVSMAGLSTSQAAAFMKQLRSHVRRERHLQALSAVWDLATPLVDDYEVETESEAVQSAASARVSVPGAATGQGSKVITEAYHIARRAIEMTLVGGFDQVTWFSSCDDTAGDKPPSSSVCVLRRLKSQQLLSLVHLCHSRGLSACFTGGVTSRDITPAVLAGADLVGVGGVGMLHHPHSGRNPTERHGPYMEENIPQVLACRDEASQTVTGRGAHLLARLDTMFFEGSLASAENGLRTQLFNALVDNDLDVVRSVLGKLQDVVELPEEVGSHPLMSCARRLVARKEPALKEVAESAYEWAMLVTRLRQLVSRGDEEGVVEEYGGEPWHTYRRKYRQRREGPHGYFRQVSFQVALKTDF